MNELGESHNPYLRQHIKNPIHWKEWMPSIFQKAKQEHKPIFISIGYSTCHWCHVMAKEAFSNLGVAKILNQSFVAVKVDREEHPEVDAYYMNAAHFMQVQGGWPLSVFANSEGEPFFIGTYYPVDSQQWRQGMGFLELLESVRYYWKEKKTEVEVTAKKMSVALEEHFSGLVLDTDKLFESEELETFGEDKVFLETHQKYFDKEYGGFKFQAHNKFPCLMNLSHLLKIFKREQNKTALMMVEQTVEGMLNGGVYDQIGGGLCRYSTDYQWMVPHFEKMLYDNALLIDLLVDLFLITKKPQYQKWSYEVVEYYETEMSTVNGFYSAEDADSEGVEGKFYFWNKEEMTQLIERWVKESKFSGVKDINVIPLLLASVWGMDKWQGDNVLACVRTIEALADEFTLSYQEVSCILEQAKKFLCVERSKRVRPFKDTKIITAWNGLMLKSYIKLARVFGDNQLIKKCKVRLEFFYNYHKETQLSRYSVEGVSTKALAGLSDYAALMVASLTFYQVSLEKKWLDWAVSLMQQAEAKFLVSNNEGMGVYSEVSSEHRFLLNKLVDAYDGVEPSGNSLMAEALIYLDSFFPSQGYEKKAEQIFYYFRTALSGTSLPYMLSVFHRFKIGLIKVELVGKRSNPLIKKWLKEILRWRNLDLLVDINDKDSLAKNNVGAIVCQNKTCSQPITDLVALKKYCENL